MKIEDIKNSDEIIDNLDTFSNDDLKILLEFYIHRLEVIAEILDKTAVNVIIDGIFNSVHNMRIFNNKCNIPNVTTLSYVDLCDALSDQIEDTLSVCSNILNKLRDKGIDSIIIDNEVAATRIQVVAGLARLAKEKYERLKSGISIERTIERLKNNKEEP